MVARPILRYPDARLRQRAEPALVGDGATRTLARDLADTLAAASAIGIAGPHVGCPMRVVVLKLRGDIVPRVYVNPAVEWSSPETGRHEEGSVSMPGIIEEVVRPARVRIAFFDLDGAARVEDADGFLAACLQHEIDQLDGVFWIERLSRLKRERVVKRFEKSRRP